MGPVSFVEVYKFCHSFFHWKFRKTWCLLKKCIAMNPESHRVNNVCFKFLYFGFILLLHFSIFIIMNIQWSKQPHYNQSCLWNLHFLVCSCYFWKDIKVFSCFKLFSFWISRPNSFVKGDEGGIFSKTPEWKSFLLLTTKIKQSLGRLPK